MVRTRRKKANVPARYSSDTETNPEVQAVATPDPAAVPSGSSVNVDESHPKRKSKSKSKKKKKSGSRCKLDKKQLADVVDQVLTAIRMSSAANSGQVDSVPQTNSKNDNAPVNNTTATSDAMSNNAITPHSMSDSQRSIGQESCQVPQTAHQPPLSMGGGRCRPS